MLEAWKAKLAGQTDQAEAYFEEYLPAERVAKLPVENILERVEAIRGVEGKPSAFEASALLGGAAEPAITVTRALAAYWSLAKDKTFGKSEDQLRRWRNPRMKAVKNFVDVVGDKALDEITADDMLDFRQWWVEKIETEDLTPNSANKDLVHLGDVLKTVNRMKRLGLSLQLSDLSLKEGERGQRPLFSNDWIKGKLLAPKALDGLNLDPNESCTPPCPNCHRYRGTS